MKASTQSDFLIQADKHRNNIKKMRELIEGLERRLKHKQNSVLSSEAEKKENNKIDTLMDLISGKGEETKEWIENSKEEINELKETNENQNNISLKENAVLSISKNLSNQYKKFQSIQYQYKHKEKEMMKETYLIACPDATDEQLNALNNTEQAEAILESAFALGSNSAKSILGEAKTRKKRIDKLVEKINKLIILIDEIDKIVKSNDEVVDNLVLTMDNIERNTGEATGELRQARIYQDRTNAWKRIIFYIFFFLAVIIFIAIGGSSFMKLFGGDDKN
ncbi:hypothetical protein A0H76_1932 [Hepatospora eriocheir]|uniref:t-SNARE coiled-coil homology domain-containing protein n=2 Tax=Hepatospora eriocheir TaxID=1081669 RepID=A0A1X0QG65_9MICR|nr:hypothetical protein A0H76_1932 [Hepatospora eriocheir]